jgi:hypothetical protein
LKIIKKKRGSKKWKRRKKRRKENEKCSIPFLFLRLAANKQTGGGYKS